MNYRTDQDVYLTMKLSKPENDKYIQAKYYDTDFVLVDTVNLTHFISGYYKVNLGNLGEGVYYVFYRVYKNSLYTQDEPKYGDVEEKFTVTGVQATEASLSSLQGILVEAMDSSDGRAI